MSGADDFYKCSEDDGGDDPDDGSDDPNTICDAEWVNDVTVTFADGTFGCSTTRDVTITCTWDADGGMAQGPQRAAFGFQCRRQEVLPQLRGGVRICVS